MVRIRDKKTFGQITVKMSLSKGNAGAKRKSILRTLPRPKNEDDIQLESGRLQISAPILTENSLGWN